MAAASSLLGGHSGDEGSPVPSALSPYFRLSLALYKSSHMSLAAVDVQTNDPCKLGVNAPTLPLKPKPNLGVFPKEVLTTISSHLDIDSAKSFGLVCRAFVVPSESRIWREINLIVPDHFGEYPLVRPFSQHDHNYCHWAQGEARQAEERGRAEARRRAEELLMLGNERRWGYVRGIAVQNRKTANGAIVQILSLTRKRLESLRIVPPPKHVFDHQWTVSFRDTLYSRLEDLVSDAPAFPAVESLDLTSCEYDWDGVFRIVIGLIDGKKLISLTMNLLDRPPTSMGPGCGESDCLYDPEVQFAMTDLNPCNLQRIDLAFALLAHDSGHSVLTHSTELIEELFDSIQRSCSTPIDFVRIVTSRKKVPRLSYPYLPEYFRSLTEFPFIKDFRCQMAVAIDLGQLLNLLSDDWVSLASLVVVGDGIDKGAKERLEFVHVPKAEGLTALLIPVDHNSPAKNTPYSMSRSLFPDAPDGVKMIDDETLCSLLRAPDLRTIQFTHQSFDDAKEIDAEDWFAYGVRGVVIRCLRGTEHFDDDNDSGVVRSKACRFCLHHIRTLTHSTPIEHNPTARIRSKEAVYKCTSTGGGKTVQRFGERDELEWEDATEFDGLVVPLSILKEMRKAAGVGPNEWNGRHVNVGEAAWRVLTDWRNRTKGVHIPVDIHAEEKAYESSEERYDETSEEEGTDLDQDV